VVLRQRALQALTPHSLASDCSRA